MGIFRAALALMKSKGTTTIAKKAAGAASPISSAAAAKGEGVLAKLSTVGFGVQAWGQIFSNWFPATISSVNVEVNGKKGTPSKYVLHVALATAFGVIARARPKIGDCGLKVTIDHMNNAVSVSYAMKVNIIGETTQKAFDLPDTVLGTAFGYNITPWNVWKVITPAGWIGMLTGAVEVPKLNPAVGGAAGLAAGLAGGAANAQKDRPLVANNTSSSSTLQRLNAGAGDYLWSDPTNALEARNFGGLARESVEAGLPPAFLFPTNKDGVPQFPEPYRSMVGPLLVGFPNGKATELAMSEQIVTRFDKLYSRGPGGGKTNAGNPEPPSPRDKGQVWKYGQPAPALPGILPADGYGYDLRSLVAAALMDPAIQPPEPPSHLALRPE